jgi:hypothetical protein
MKPTLQINHKQCGSPRDNGTRRSKRRLLLTDYNYRPAPEPQMGSSAGQPVTKLPAFHKLSSELLGAEKSRDYVGELLFFIVITGAAAWPIMSMLIAVIRMIRNY